MIWRKSSYSGPEDPNCVEVAGIPWHTSSYSHGANSSCVEVAETSQHVHVRDAQNRRLGHLTFGADAWAAFLGEVRRGEWQ